MHRLHLFNQLGCTGKEDRQHHKAECLSGFEIDDYRKSAVLVKRLDVAIKGRSSIKPHASQLADALVVHYRFSTRIGQDMGRKIGLLVVQNLMRSTKVAETR